MLYAEYISLHSKGNTFALFYCWRERRNVLRFGRTGALRRGTLCVLYRRLFTSFLFRCIASCPDLVVLYSLIRSVCPLMTFLSELFNLSIIYLRTWKGSLRTWKDRQSFRGIKTIKCLQLWRFLFHYSHEMSHRLCEPRAGIDKYDREMRFFRSMLVPSNLRFRGVQTLREIDAQHIETT